MPLTSLVGPHSGTGTYLDANASASEPQLIQIAKPSADTHMGKSEKRLKDAEIYVPIVYGTVAFWLGRKATETQSHKWTVYVRGATNEDLSVIIKRAVFQLHPSFNNPVRVVESPPFEVSECGWGEFEIGISLYFHNDVSEKKLDLYHPLKLYSENEPGPLSTKKPVVMENYDEIVFPEPSEDFLSRVKGHPAAVVPRLPATFNLPQRRDAPHSFTLIFKTTSIGELSAMAAVNFLKVLAVFVAVMVAVSAVSAQEAAPAPSPASGASSLPVIGAVLVSSMLLSLATLIKH